MISGFHVSASGNFTLFSNKQHAVYASTLFPNLQLAIAIRLLWMGLCNLDGFACRIVSKLARIKEMKISKHFNFNDNVFGGL